MNLKDATEEDVINVLITAMDNGNWHTPSAGKLIIKEQTTHCIYGEFESSLHNTFWDKRLGFNINATSLHLWDIISEVDENGVKERRRCRNIYNLQSICKWLLSFSEVINEQINK